jgi:hypothetical protein
VGLAYAAIPAHRAENQTPAQTKAGSIQRTGSFILIINGRIIKDWDKSQISTAYQRPNQFRVITWDMGRVQSWLLGKQPLARTLLEKVIR